MPDGLTAILITAIAIGLLVARKLRRQERQRQEREFTDALLVYTQERERQQAPSEHVYDAARYLTGSTAAGRPKRNLTQEPLPPTLMVIRLTPPPEGYNERNN